MVERALAVLGLAGAILVALALTGALHAPAVPGANGAQYCPVDQYGNQYGDCVDDTIPPTISAAQSPAANANGWNNTNVMLTFTASDEVGGSGVRSIDCNLGGTTNGSTRGILFTATTVDSLVTCTAMDWAGNVSAPATVNVLIDRVRPTIVLQSRNPPPDPYGWNDTDVTVIWACSDAFSGAVSPTVSRTVTTSGQNQTATGTCTDLAGNTSSNTVFGINIDKTAIPPTGGPPNDNIANATVVSSLPFVDATADTTNATKEVHEPSCFFPADDKTIWYRYTAPSAGVVRFSLSGNIPLGATPVVSAWRSTPSGLFSVGCGFSGLITFSVQAGTTYYVKAGSRTTGTGPFSVNLEAVVPPPNDAFANAKPIGSLPFSDAVDLTGATVETGEPLRPNGTFSPLTATAWYALTPAVDEQVVLGGTAATSTVVAVYTGSTLTGLTQVAGSFGLFPNGGVSYLQPVVLDAHAGTTYWIQLGELFPGNSLDERVVFGVERPIVFLGQTPAANGSGWNNTDVRLDWSCSPLLTFGFQTSATATLTTEGTNQSATGTCSSFFTSVQDTEAGIDIDKTPPAIAFPHGPIAPVAGSFGPPATATVDCAADPGALGPALAAASDGDVIGITGTCAGTFELTRNLTLEGLGAAALDAQGLGTVLTVDPGVSAVVTGLTVTGGSTLYDGGGIFNSGNLTVANSTVSLNKVLSGDGGGIYNAGTLTLTRSVVRGNTAWSHGGGLSNDSFGTLVVKNSSVTGNGAGFAGGGIFSFGSLDLEGSTVSGNYGSVAFFDIGGAGIYAAAANATIRNSVVSDNTASGNGGGILNSGTLAVSNSTVSGNRAGSSSGGGIYTAGSLTLTNSSIAGNTGFTGAGIQEGSGTLDVRATTITGNTATSSGPGSGGGILVGFGSGTIRTSLLAGNDGGSCSFSFGQLADGGGNLDDGTSCGFGVGSLSNTDPLLDPAGLADHGGPTRTVSVLAGSPAIDAGAPGVNGCGTTLAVDQRGAPRPQGAGCDIGAFEAGPAAPPAAFTPEPNANGWSKSALSLTWICEDALSGAVAPQPTVTLADEGGGQTAHGLCTDLAGNTASDAEEGSVDETPPNAPAVSADRAPEYAGGGGWFRDSVTVSFAAAGDPHGANGTAGSGVDPASLPAPVTFDTQGEHTASGSVADRAGNVSAPGSLTVQVDTEAPELTATFANADGSDYVPGTWTHQSVTVTFHCTDTGGSGVATTALPHTVSTQGENQSVAGSCTDQVGHTTTRTFGGIDIDLTAPEGTLVLDPGSLDLVLRPSDEGGSGIDPGAVTPIVVPGKGAAQTRTYLFADGAGNRTKIVVEVKPATGAIQATVAGISYNGGGAPVAVPFTSLSYSWATTRDGSLKSLDQTITVGKGGSQQLVDASYDASKNETKITGTLGSSTVAGLELIRVVSSAGALVVEL